MASRGILSARTMQVDIKLDVLYNPSLYVIMALLIYKDFSDELHWTVQSASDALLYWCQGKQIL